jgi:hypothetical protein
MTVLVRAAELPRSSTYMSVGEQDLVPGSLSSILNTIAVQITVLRQSLQLLCVVLVREIC